MLETQTMSFHGAVLKRGFWLYTWKIKSRKQQYFYVGRTGDNSSSNASSPFSRVGMHLDIRPNATANCIVRLLREQNIDPEKCEYEMFAIGPLFPEQNSFEKHKPYRNMVGLLEAELAYFLKENKCHVLGTHPRRGKYDKTLFSVIKKKVKNHYGFVS